MVSRRKPDSQLKAMTDFTAHLRKCYDCKGAIKSNYDSGFCRDGMMLAVGSARAFAKLSTLHSAAFRHEGQTVYACPEPGRHGASYKMTATPLMVTAFQDVIF